ncbi:MAG: PDDEXK nuclease domain-containing protein, partial [Chitinophagaceae bacterium]
LFSLRTSRIRCVRCVTLRQQKQDAPAVFFISRSYNMTLMPLDQFNQIVRLIQLSRDRSIRAVNTELISLYWTIGEYISLQLQKASWGEKTIDELASHIKKYHPEIKGFDRRGLYRMRQFFETYQNSPLRPAGTEVSQSIKSESVEIVTPVVSQLKVDELKASPLTKVSWTNHLIILGSCKSYEEREYYLRLCIRERYSKRELERQIRSGVFERSQGGTQFSPSLIKTHPDIIHTFKDSYVFEFLNMHEPIREADLQKGLIRQMKEFILELGKDFLFVGEQVKLRVGLSDFFIDLLFFHRGLQCLIAVELKADKFRPEHLGQLNFYLEALDRDVKKKNENPSIGVLLCKGKDKEVVEYAMNRNISPALVSAYILQLPDKEVLQNKLHEIFEGNKS